MIRFILVQNRQGKTRLSKFYVPYDDDEKIRLRGEVHRLIAPRDQKYQSNFVEVSDPRYFALHLANYSDADSNTCLLCCKKQFRNYKLVYRRYAGLFFCVCVDANDNELAYLEAIHLFVEVLGAFSFTPHPKVHPRRKQANVHIMGITACSAHRRFLWQRMRARPRLQLLQSVCYPR